MDDHHERVGATNQARQGGASQAFNTPPPSEAKLPTGVNEPAFTKTPPWQQQQARATGGQRRVGSIVVKTKDKGAQTKSLSLLLLLLLQQHLLDDLLLLDQESANHAARAENREAAHEHDA